MRIVDRNMQLVRSLSSHELELLSGFVSGNQTGRDAESCSALLRSIRHERHWLGCDCRLPMPVLNVALMDSGRLVLRNNPDGSQHAENCLYAHEYAPGGAPAAIKSQIIERESYDQPIALHVEFSGTRKGVVQQISRSGAVSAPQKKPLLSLLLTLMDVAGLTTYNPATKMPVADQFAGIRNAAQRFTLSPGLPMNGYLDTRISKQRLVALSDRLKKADVFAGHRRVGLLIDQVESVSGRKVEVVNGGSVEFFGHVERQGSSSFPALAMATVTTAKSGSRFYELAHISMVPIVGEGCMFPVLDDHERLHVLDLFGLLGWLHRTKSIVVMALRHPFSDESASFIELRSNRLIIWLDLRAPCPSAHRESTPHSLLRLGDFESMAALKKQIVARFLGSLSK